MALTPTDVLAIVTPTLQSQITLGQHLKLLVDTVQALLQENQKLKEALAASSKEDTK